MAELEQIRPREGTYNKNAARDDYAVAGEEARDLWPATHFAS